MDINPVLLEDDAVFQCQVGAAGEISSIMAKHKMAKMSTLKCEKTHICNEKVFAIWATFIWNCYRL